MVRRGWLLLALAMMIGVIYADDDSGAIYKSTDSNGNPSFSDKPSTGAQVVDVAPVQSFSMPATSAPAATSNAPAIADSSYQSITIVSPPLDTTPSGQEPSGPPGATLWDNNGEATINVAIDPSLHPGDTLQLLVNGAVAQQSKTATTFNLTDLNSDQYSVVAQIVDGSGNVKISSTPLTLFLRHHLANQIPPTNTVQQNAQQVIQNHPGAANQARQIIQNRTN